MFGYRFPRTYADLREAPWCRSYESWVGTDGVFIHVNLEWLDLEGVDRVCSAHGETLKGALQDLKDELWHDMRPPSKAMGDGVLKIARQMMPKQEG